jgi:hypothetical protein
MSERDLDHKAFERLERTSLMMPIILKKDGLYGLMVFLADAQLSQREMRILCSYVRENQSMTPALIKQAKKRVGLEGWGEPRPERL